MSVFFPFAFIPFCVQLFALNSVKNHFLRWLPLGIMELLLVIGMVRHIIDPPSVDILGWKIYLWLIGSVFLGGMSAWGVCVLYNRRKR